MHSEARHGHSATPVTGDVTTIKLSTGFGLANGNLLGSTYEGNFNEMTQRGATACDINGDNRDDLVFVAPLADEGSHTNNGAIFIVYGTATPESNYTIGSDASVTIIGAADGSKIGEIVECFDFNGDGDGDLMIQSYDDNVFIVLGDPSLSGTLDLADSNDYDFLVSTISRPAGVGNFNGDGFDDLVTCDNGTCKLYLGGATPNVTEDATYSFTPQTGNPNYYFKSGDANGDGYDDLMMGEHYQAGNFGTVSSAGVVHIYFGSADPTSPSSSHTSADVTIYGYQPNSYTAPYARGADMDGDGYEETILRGHSYDSFVDTFVVFGTDSAGWS